VTHTYTHTVVVTDPVGLHARPIGQIVSLVKAEGVEVTLRRPSGPDVSASSALRLLAMKVKTGEEIAVVVEALDIETATRVALEIDSYINQG
jgi:phosphocarrier protein